MNEIDTLRRAPAAMAAMESALVQIAADDGAAKLCRGIAWAERFSFHVAGCASSKLAAALQVWLLDAVPREREQAITHVRISPYPLDWREPDPPLVRGAALDTLVETLLSDAAQADLIVLDGARARPPEAEPWSRVFALLNMQRNVLSRDVRGALLLVLPPPLVREFALTAGDLWSIRSSAIELADTVDMRKAPMLASGDFTSDGELLRMAQAGNKQATNVLRQRITRVIQGIVKSTGMADIDELTQDVLLQLLSMDLDSRDVKGFVSQIAARRAIDHMLKLSRLPQRLDITPEALIDTEAFESIDGWIERIRAMLSLLSPELREIVELQLDDGLSVGEIASKLNRPPSLIYRRKQAALSQLRILLGELEGPFR